MRIIAGTKRGMKLLSPKTQGAWPQVSRPITDRVKESLFSVLYNYDLPDGARVADLFSGVGSLGLEALSRGAVFVTFVEKDPDVVSILKKNIEKGGFAGDSKVIRANAFQTGAALDCGAERYDLVFVDPPYALTENVSAGSALSGLLDLLGEQVAAESVVVVRTSRDVSLLEQYGKLRVAERRQWGTMKVAILMKDRI
ncbi:MAG: RsmD family RNA methyltransferase [Planctomycetota bacterium]